MKNFRSIEEQMELNLQEKQKDLFKSEQNVKHVLREHVRDWTTQLLPIERGDTLIAPIPAANCVATLYDVESVYIQHSERYSNSIGWAEGAVFAKFKYLVKPENLEKEI